MAIYLTGDTHGDFSRFLENEYKNLKKSDYVIVTGDCGLVYGSGTEFFVKSKLIESLPFTILFVDGNHENHDWLNKFEVTNWKGGKVHKILKNCYHLMRGQVFKIDNKTFFTMGGATSVDKHLRIEGVSWWRSEIPSFNEYNEALDNLEKHKNKVDYIITHSAPDNVLYNINPNFTQDSVTNFLYEIEQKVEFKHWYIGHYHLDTDIDSKHTILYFSKIKI